MENGIQGKVFIQFVIERDGSITDVKVARGVDASLDKEAVRVVQSMPKWKPGKQRGKPVRVAYTLPINFLLPIPGTPLGDADISELTTEYCMKVLCLARLLVPQSDIRCAAGREVYFKGEEKRLLSVVNSIFASGYLTEDGQGIEDTIKVIEDAGFTYEIESA